MKLLYGTTNKAKIKVMEKAVRGLGIELFSLNDLNSELPMINENGRTPLENAEIKAQAYYEKFHMPVFSCDSGLYFDGLEDEGQPGLYIRRVNGKPSNFSCLNISLAQFHFVSFRCRLHVYRIKKERMVL